MSTDAEHTAEGAPPAKDDGTRPIGPGNRRDLWSRLLIIVFLAMLAAPSLDLAFRLDPNPLPVREPVPFPKVKVDRSLAKLPGNLLWYVKSTMGFQGTLVRAHGLLKQRVGVSPAPAMVLISGSWFFLKGERVLDDYRRIDPFTEIQLERWRSVLDRRREWLERRNVRFALAIAPNKETIYAERMPGWISRVPGPSRLDQLIRHMAERSSVPIIDCRPGILDRKAERRVYHVTDTHWNDVGAFWGYRAIASRLQVWYPGLRPLHWEDCTITEKVTAGGDLARMCGLKRDRLETQLVIDSPFLAARAEDGSPLKFDRLDVRGRRQLKTRSSAGEIPSGLILCDSFGELLVPYLSQHVQQATWLWTYDFPHERIESERPAIVIQQIVERRLMTLTPHNPQALERE